MKRTIIISAALGILGFASVCVGREHNLLNGTWVLVPIETHYADQPAIQTGTVTINEREGNITVSRSFVYKGANETFHYDDIADSENNATIRAGKEFKSKAKWDHDVLKVTTTQSGITTVESYMPGANGSMTATIAKLGQEPVTLVFHRK